MNRRKTNGFSLIGLMVAMAIASIVGVVIMSAYQVQVRGKNTQEALTDMNQTARAAFGLMENEIRMAGLDPEETSGARIILANDGELIFSLDRSDGVTNAPDADCCDENEVIRYHLSPANADADNDGINDNIVSGVECNLGRETGCGLIGAPLPNCCPGLATRNGLQPVGPNVDALNFVYLTDDNNGDGLPDVMATPVATQANRDRIRSIEVTIVARAGMESGGFLGEYTNNDAYFNQQGQQILPAQGDRFRRLRLATTLNCRNLGN